MHLYNSAVPVSLGSSRLLASGQLKGRKVGIVSNPASVDANYVHIVDALMNAPGVTVGAVFGPQHGFRSDVQDNMIETPHGNDCRRKVPVFSLYSETREPTAEMLRHVDTMVDRSAGHRRAHLHLHLHDGELPARVREARHRRHRVRSAESDRRRRRRRPDAGAGQRIVRRAVSDPDASRHDDRRAREILQRVLRDQGAARGDPNGGLERDRCTSIRPACLS